MKLTTSDKPRYYSSIMTMQGNLIEICWADLNRNMLSILYHYTHVYEVKENYNTSELPLDRSIENTYRKALAFAKAFP